MPAVKNVTLEQIDIGDGRLIAAGRTVEDVDLDQPAVEQHLETGALLDVTEPEEPTARERIGQIQAADPVMLDAIETAERDRLEPRKTVIDAIAARRAHQDTDHDSEETSA